MSKNVMSNVEYDAQPALEAVNPNLETPSRLDGSEGKQVIIPDGLHTNNFAHQNQLYYDQDGEKHPHYYDARFSELQSPPPQTITKSRRKWYAIAGALALIVVIAVCVSVGVVVSRNKNHDAAAPASSPEPSSPAAQDLPVDATISPTPITAKTSGNALKGSRLTTMDPQTGGDIFLFFQWDDGGVRYIYQSGDRVWQGSTDLHIPDAKPATPLAAVSTGTESSAMWWLFYVDSSNVIQSMYSQKDPTKWQKGNVGTKNYKVPNDTNIAFALSRGWKYNATFNGLDGGLSLYASGTNGTIQEYLYDDQDKSWSDGFTFLNADGYRGANTWSTSGDAFMYTANEKGSLQYWYRDYKVGSGWALISSSHESLIQKGSMCGSQHHFAFQGSDGLIQGYNFTTNGSPEKDRWGSTYSITDQTAMEGSAMNCWYFFPSETADPNIMFQVFYQTKKGGIQEAIRTWAPDNATTPGIWKSDSLPL